MDTEKTPMIYKANALVEASYRLSMYEQRIVLSAISQVRRDEELTDEVLYAVSALDVAEFAGITLNTSYKNLQTAADRLLDRRVTLYKAPNDSRQPPPRRVTRWVQTIDYYPDEGEVRLRFSKDIIPYLSQLSAEFTRYALADIALMTSAYAVRLYELLVQWKATGKPRKITVESLRETFQLEGRHKEMRDLKKWVINPAVEQVNEHTPLWVTLDQKTRGRKITHFIFTFGEKNPERKVVRKNPNKQAQAVEPPAGKPKASRTRTVLGWPIATIEREGLPGEDEYDVARRLDQEKKSRADAKKEAKRDGNDEK